MCPTCSLYLYSVAAVFLFSFSSAANVVILQTARLSATMHLIFAYEC